LHPEEGDELVNYKAMCGMWDIAFKNIKQLYNGGKRL
jgi:hypothetical protein